MFIIWYFSEQTWSLDENVWKIIIWEWTVSLTAENDYMIISRFDNQKNVCAPLEFKTLAIEFENCFCNCDYMVSHLTNKRITSTGAAHSQHLCVYKYIEKHWISYLSNVMCWLCCWCSLCVCGELKKCTRQRQFIFQRIASHRIRNFSALTKFAEIWNTIWFLFFYFNWIF